jgi:hypothetical protein
MSEVNHGIVMLMPDYSNWTEWTEQRLQKLFQRYDLKFFDGRLSENGWTVKVKSIPRRGQGMVMFKFFTDEYEKQILFDPLYCWSNNWRMRADLLHEMAHAASGDGGHHENGAWCAEMKRLKVAGAPVGAGLHYERKQERAWKK